MRRRIVLILIFIISIFLIVFFIQNTYKKINVGNNTINKTTSQIVNTILNMKTYSAKINLKVISNKNENTYTIEQKSTGNQKYTCHKSCFRFPGSK